MMENEQMEMDLRLDADEELEENVEILIALASKQLLSSQIEDKRIKNRHEGYGILAERFIKVNAGLKNVKDEMGVFLRLLSTGDREAMDAVEKINHVLSDMITDAVKMAAESLRISNDLYKNLSEIKSPLEKYAEGVEAAEEDFEEAPEETPEETPEVEGNDKENCEEDSENEE